VASGTPPPIPGSRQLIDQAFTRASGAPLVPDNRLRLLKDAPANFTAWLDAIRGARRTIYFENYIIEDDHVGIAFAEALAERARAGVCVRLIRDWLGCFNTASRGFWRRLADAGVQLRVYNPPRWDRPLGWLQRDHRKVVSVDGEVAFVGGLCISQRWLGEPEKGNAAWRDTGVELSGPAVSYIERAFAQVWAATGPPLPPEELAAPEAIAPAGHTAVRVIADAPASAGFFRLEQLIAVAARRTLWLTDAYFVGMASHVEALRAAAKDGVDVRLLLPNASDIPAIVPISRAGYRSLLEAGVRVFEWNGTMLHAKTAVADGRWSRVGSSNLNWQSFMANYELDIEVEDETFAAAMEAMYLEDLQNATEIVLTGRRQRVRPDPGAPEQPRRRRRPPRGGSSVVATGALRAANAFGAAVGRRRTLGPGDRRLALSVALVLTMLATVAVVWPRVVAWTFAAIAIWLALAVTLRTARARAEERRR